MNRHSLISLFIAILLSVSCHPTQVDMAFIENPIIRLEYKGECIFSYDPLKCQLFFDKESALFRVGNDTMSDYFSLDLVKLPKELSDQVIGNIKWIVGQNISDKRNITLKVVKLEGDRIWLWAAKEQIGIVVRMLD